MTKLLLPVKQIVTWKRTFCCAAASVIELFYHTFVFIICILHQRNATCRQKYICNIKKSILICCKLPFEMVNLIYIVNICHWTVLENPVIWWTMNFQRIHHLKESKNISRISFISVVIFTWPVGGWGGGVSPRHPVAKPKAATMASYRVSDSKGHLVQSDRAPYVWIQILYAALFFVRLRPSVSRFRRRIIAVSWWVSCTWSHGL